MKKQYIKVPIPVEISEDGGASVLFVNKQTVPLDGAITEALAGNYCTGQATLIRNFFFGLMQSMADGVRRDGHARQIANFLTVYPVFKGEIDLDRGYDPEVNGVMIRARLLNEMDLDITDWSFEDVTDGKRSFKLDSVKAGPVMGVYQLGETGNLNGKDLPSTEAGETLRVHWAVEGTDKSGDIPAEKISSDVSRIDIAADALAEIATAEYDGKTVVFTVRGNFSSAKISATLKYDLPDPTYPITSEDGKFKLDQPTAVRPSADALNCTFEIVEGLGELYPAVGLAGTKLSKSLVSAEGGVACTYCNIDETFPSRLHVRFGAHDAQVGDKRYVHLTYAEGKKMVLPVTVTEEE